MWRPLSRLSACGPSAALRERGGGGAGGPWTLKQSVSVSIYTITRRVVLQSDVRTMLSLRLRGSSRAALYMAHISRYPCA